MKTILLLLAFFVTTAHSATVRLYFVDPLTNDKDTNAFYVTPIGTNVLSNGGVVGRGNTVRYVPASNGYATNTLAVGHYSITNRSLGSGIVIRVPDSSSLYDYTNLLISGYNIFVTVTNSGSGSGDVTQSGLAAGSYAINGQPITNFMSVLSQLENGSAKTSRSPGSHAFGGNNASNYVIAAAGIQGILKTLFCHLDVGSTGGLETNINNLDLLIYTDGTATGNLTARIKVADLLNCFYRYPSTNWTIRNTSRFLSFYTDPLSMRSGFPLYHFTLTLPMPFTNGMSCKLTNNASATPWTHGYFQSQYELKTLPPELLTTRLYITNIHGAVSASTSNYLFTTSGATEIVGFQVGASNDVLSNIEGVWADKGLAFYIDSTVFTYDLDDWLENTYAGAFGQFIGYDIGWPHNDYDESSTYGAMESYKWLCRDSIRSTNSMVIYSDANVVINSAYYNFFYYKR